MARFPSSTVRRVLSALALTACTACSAARAAPPPPPERPHPLPAIAIAARLAPAAAALPVVTGVPLQEARARLAGLGTQVQVVAFDAGAVVTVQYPEAGAALPADGVVTLWTGAPPAPPVPPRLDPVEPSAPPPEPSAARPAVPVAPPEALAPPPRAPQGAAVGAPARTNPRHAPPASPGAALQGLASWYGPEFAGRTTACGDAFDPARLSLASRELRCGTVVVVAGPGGASVQATVTDWGPAEWTGRRFDLSQAAFAAIAPLGAGVVPVTVQVVA